MPIGGRSYLPMPLEVYKLTVQMGFRRDLGPELSNNVFYFRVDNSAGLNSLDAGADLSDALWQTLGWAFRWRNLFNIATHIRGWRIVRVLPAPGATFDDSLQLYNVTGLRFVVAGIHYLATNVNWIVEDSKPRLPYNQVGFVAKNDWVDDRIWTPYLIQVGQWAQVHATADITTAGNPFYGVCKRGFNDIVPISGFRINETPGRRLTRRESR